MQAAALAAQSMTPSAMAAVIFNFANNMPAPAPGQPGDLLAKNRPRLLIQGRGSRGSCSHNEPLPEMITPAPRLDPDLTRDAAGHAIKPARYRFALADAARLAHQHDKRRLKR